MDRLIRNVFVAVEDLKSGWKSFVCFGTSSRSLALSPVVFGAQASTSINYASIDGQYRNRSVAGHWQ